AVPEARGFGLDLDDVDRAEPGPELERIEVRPARKRPPAAPRVPVPVEAEEKRVVDRGLYVRHERPPRDNRPSHARPRAVPGSAALRTGAWPAVTPAGSTPRTPLS